VVAAAASGSPALRVLCNQPGAAPGRAGLRGGAVGSSLRWMRGAAAAEARADLLAVLGPRVGCLHGLARGLLGW
jgi:hypothetical protein